jgi:hypothetical protein
MIALTPQKGPTPAGIFSYDYWHRGECLEVTSEADSKPRIAFFENETSQYLRNLLYRVFKKTFLEGVSCWRVSDSTYGVSSNETLKEVNNFFSKSNEILMDSLEERRNYFIRKNKINKVVKFEERINYLKTHKLKFCLASYTVSEVN